MLLHMFLEQGISEPALATGDLPIRRFPESPGGIRINREFGCVSLVSTPANVARLIDVFREAITSQIEIHLLFHTSSSNGQDLRPIY